MSMLGFHTISHGKSKSHIPVRLQVHPTQKIAHKKTMRYYNSNSLLSGAESLADTHNLPFILVKHSNHHIQKATAEAYKSSKPCLNEKENMKSVEHRACNVSTPKAALNDVRIVRKVLPSTIKEGWLWKMTNEEKWIRKYCVLTNDSLVYYNHKVGHKIQATINFSLSPCKVTIPSVEDVRYFKISLVNEKKNYTFRGEDIETTKEWFNLIVKKINTKNSYLATRRHVFHKVT